MKKLYIERDSELNAERLIRIIRYFQQNIAPELKFNRGYYDGVGQQIMSRTYDDPTKPNNRIVKNYCKTIVENFRGYICGVPITYTTDADNADILYKTLEDNDVSNSDSE